jgi:hypothetical protein
MTAKVNGFAKSGNWGEKDYTWLKVDAGSAAVFTAPTAPDQTMDYVLRALETRGVVVAYNVSSDFTKMYVLYGASAGSFGATGTTANATAPASGTNTSPGTPLSIPTGNPMAEVATQLANLSTVFPTVTTLSNGTYSQALSSSPVVPATTVFTLTKCAGFTADNTVV